MSPSATQIYLQRSFSRRDYLQLIQTAYTFQEYSFAAQVALDWLTDFPGDLPMRYFYGVARLKAGQASLGIAILDQVLQLDPEFTEALQARLEIEIQVDRGAIKLAPSSHRSSYSLADYREWLNALQGYRPGSVKHPYPSLEMRWGEELYRIRKSLEVSSALEDELFAREVQNQLKPLLARKSAHPLVAITHVRSLYLSYKAGRHPLPALRQVVAHYRHTFPRCLYFAYVAVEISMENGEQDQAVALLHSLAAQDLTAQVFQRLWSPEHPFLEIWPKNLEKRLDVPIPARIATIFGWNRLPEPGNEWERRAVDQPTEQAEEGVVSALSQKSNGHSRPPVEPPYLKKDHLDLDPPTRSLVEAVPSPLAEELRKVQEVFNQLAMRLKQPHLQYLDGRRPVYVALTNKSQLGRYFPPEKVCQVQEAILELLSAIQESQGWQGLLYNVDEGLTLSLRNQTVHIAPVSQNDPWAIKRSLHQLDQLLAKRGEMIGAVLIVGPHEVIPFHRLPNPLEDGDPEVYSDNPYGARDENYFVMDWPVGRLPCS
ncbi:MAG: hypothetical protein NZ840_06025, partial [Anaerolineales bacterium]|nr:hypothetical protein [Anaerolineales bacterium]MDW8161595.1 hypothetical protein [Anaerolineales bacterium]